MHRSINYYFSLVSPWAYIGHATFMNLTQRHSLDVNFKPVSLPSICRNRRPAAQQARASDSAIESWNCSAGARNAVCD
jgi:2-hydroxychromene-2-carboxylate isomerase